MSASMSSAPRMRGAMMEEKREMTKSLGMDMMSKKSASKPQKNDKAGGSMMKSLFSGMSNMFSKESSAKPQVPKAPPSFSNKKTKGAM